MAVPMSEQTYNLRVRELFAHLAHAGSLNPAHDLLRFTVGTHEQGAYAEFSVAHGKSCIELVRYQAYGCPHFLAACEWLGSWLEGRAWLELSMWDWRDVEHVLDVPANKRARLLLLDDVIGQLRRLQPG